MSSDATILGHVGGRPRPTASAVGLRLRLRLGLRLRRRPPELVHRPNDRHELRSQQIDRALETVGPGLRGF